MFLPSVGSGLGLEGGGGPPSGAKKFLHAPPHIFRLEMAPLCSLCASRHYGYQAHVFATNGATNRVATNADATNRVATKNPGEVREPAKELCAGPGVRSGSPDGGQDGGSEAGAGRGDRVANRRTREAYNAYQREYMRKRRLNRG